MDAKAFYCVFYIFLLTMTVPSLCIRETLEDTARDHEVRDKRQLQAVGPIAAYAGIAVSPWVWAALLAVYGLTLLNQYRVSRTSNDDHACAGNRGWCRSSCRSYEYIDNYHSAVCGRYKCCRSR
ncbi:big defensin-like [Dreissena polymorpha]|uniref:Big defensin n=1 Tax=Dreissena polymorpha TaxID=45954 RepID=A0A9D4BHL6_DREPO|nr:big defensin-like [Dreissena polymorpha]XP_052255725.1 big defensin-like [Dreissena polymorpha]KAH3695875.1 hypothetical protein DPMN_083333 [Dreissena polymorpha]